MVAQTGVRGRQDTSERVDIFGAQCRKAFVNPKFLTYDVEKAAGFGTGEASGERGKFVERMPGGGIAVRLQPESLQPANSSGAAGIVLRVHTARLFRGRKAVGHQERPIRRNRDRIQLERIEPYQERATGLARKNGRVIHTSAAGPYELLAFGQNVEKLADFGSETVRLEQSKGKANQKSGGGGQAGGGGQVRNDRAIDADRQFPAAGRHLHTSFQVVRPITPRPGFRGSTETELAVTVGGGNRTDLAVGTRPKGEANAALKRHGQHGQTVIVHVFADQIDASGNGNEAGRTTGSEGRVQKAGRFTSGTFV
jgi:hypothetical protein